LGGCRNQPENEINDDDPLAIFKKKPDSYHFRFDSTRSEAENFVSGYIDTFSIGGTHFRILCDSTPGKELLLQKKEGGIWTDNLYSFFGVQGYNREADVNRDGFPDFVFFNRIDCNAYLFDSVKKRFNFYPVNLSLVYDMQDSVRNIFHQEWFQEEGVFICTQLYRYRDSLPQYLYSAYPANEIPASGNQKTFRLYRCENGKMKDTLFLRTCKADSPYSAQSMRRFWTEVVPE
jgi:hypothetical protein